jgi:BTB/POZ domain
VIIVRMTNKKKTKEEEEQFFVVVGQTNPALTHTTHVFQVKKKRDDDRPVVTEATRKEYFRDMKDLLQDEEATDCVFHVVTKDRHRIDDDDDEEDDDNDDGDDGDEEDNNNHNEDEQEEYTPLRAHKAIITAQSDYFKALFRKNAFIDGKECIVRVDPAYSVRHVEAVLTYLYTTSTASLMNMTLANLLLLLQLADLWLLTNLKARIEDILKEHIAVHTVTRLYVMASTTRLRSACLDFILRNLKKLADNTEMQQLMAQDPELFMPVLRAAADLVVIPHNNHHNHHHHNHHSSTSSNNNNNNKRQRTGGGGGTTGSRHPLETPSSMA